MLEGRTALPETQKGGTHTMPYDIRKVKGGYKVGHKGTSKTYSKHPQSHEMAERQLRAIHMHAGAEDGRKS